MNHKPSAQKDLGYNYFVFGLHFRSNLPLPGVNPDNSSTESCEVELHLGRRPYSDEENSRRSEELTYASADMNAAGEPALRIFKVDQGAFVRLAYEDGTQFWLDGKREKFGRPQPALKTQPILGPILGPVAFGDLPPPVQWLLKIVRFVPARAGKSTTAAASPDKGTVISDTLLPGGTR